MVSLLLTAGCSDEGAWDIIGRLQSQFQDAEWLDPSFQYRHWLTFKNGAATEDLIDFPVLVTLTRDRVNYGAMGADDGSDIRFTDSDGVTVLDHQINTWSFDGTSTFWVRVPRIDEKSSADHIWLYYGNSAAASVENKTGVWDSGYRGVWHLSDLQDSTANGNAGTNAGTTPTTGVIGSAREFDGSAFIRIGNPESLQITDALTLEAWCYRRSAGYQVVVGKYDYLLNDRSYMLGFDRLDLPGGPCAIVSENGDFDDAGFVEHSGSDVFNTWMHVAAVFGPNRLRLYVNGVRVAEDTPSFTTLFDTTENVIIGGCDDGLYLRFDGMLDEVRISATARSDSWIRAQYLSMTDAFVGYGPAQSR